MAAAPYRNDPRITIQQAVRGRLSISTVITPIAPLHRKASRRSGQETQLLYGHEFDVYRVSMGWVWGQARTCLLYTSPSPRDATLSRMPSSA